MAPPRTSFRPHCNQPKLVHTIPPFAPAWPAVLAFYCAPCSHAETKEHRLNSAPGTFYSSGPGVGKYGPHRGAKHRQGSAAHCEKRAASATDRTVQATFAEAAHCWRELARCWRECQSNAPTAEKVRA